MTARPRRVMGPADPPVFVVGAPRSGASFLYKLLCLHPDSTWVSNWVGRRPYLGPLASLNRLAARAHRMRHSAWFRSDDRTPLARAFPRPVESGSLFSAYDVPEASDAVEATRRQTSLRRAVGDLARFGGGRVFVSRQAAHGRRLPLLHAIFPRARIVVVHRDGRAVAESLSRTDWWPGSHVWWFGDTPLAWEEKGGDPWDLCARHWVREVEAIEHGLARLPSAAVLHVRYEDFTADPAATLDGVGEFVGMPAGRRWRRAVGRVDLPVADDGWRARLGSAAARVEDVQAGWLRKYEYLS
ncbi:MAG: hypothetical protein GEV10_29890 [Streptosporangiales bacterium]|nr:hypothetical protein [Streptosporangiales bacterium]